MSPIEAAPDNDNWNPSSGFSPATRGGALHSQRQANAQACVHLSYRPKTSSLMPSIRATGLSAPLRRRSIGYLPPTLVDSPLPLFEAVIQPRSDQLSALSIPAALGWGKGRHLQCKIPPGRLELGPPICVGLPRSSRSDFTFASLGQGTLQNASGYPQRSGYVGIARGV